jgi:hypothetical protein
MCFCPDARRADPCDCPAVIALQLAFYTLNLFPSRSQNSPHEIRRGLTWNDLQFLEKNGITVNDFAELAYNCTTVNQTEWSGETPSVGARQLDGEVSITVVKRTGCSAEILSPG